MLNEGPKLLKSASEKGKTTFKRGHLIMNWGSSEVVCWVMIIKSKNGSHSLPGFFVLNIVLMKNVMQNFNAMIIVVDSIFHWV